MDNPCFVRRNERSGHLDRHIEDFLRFHRPALQTLAQGFAVDQFARNIVSRAILADLVNGQNIWMIESNYGARFLFKPPQALRIAGKARWQELERGLATRCDVGGQVDLAHPA